MTLRLPPNPPCVHVFSAATLIVSLLHFTQFQMDITAFLPTVGQNLQLSILQVTNVCGKLACHYPTRLDSHEKIHSQIPLIVFTAALCF